MNRERAAEVVVLASLCVAALLVTAGSHPGRASGAASATPSLAAANATGASSAAQISATQAALATGLSSNACRRPVPRMARAGLPWPVVISTGCGRYEVRPSGQVRTLPPARPLRPSRFLPASGAEAAKVRHGHVVILSGARAVWRSKGASYRFQDLGSVAIGPAGVAFSVYGSSGSNSSRIRVSSRPSSSLYFVSGRGPEHATRLNLEALEWMPAGTLLVSKWHSQGRPDLRLLDGRGQVARTVVRQVRGYALEPSTRDVLFVDSAGRLRRADGNPASDPARLADLTSMGFRFDLESWFPGITPLRDGRIVLSAPNRMVILSHAGAVEAESTFSVPSKGYGWVGSEDSTTVDPVRGRSYSS